MIAHISGMPVEELVPALAGAGTGALFVRMWWSMRVRRKQENK